MRGRRPAPRPPGGGGRPVPAACPQGKPGVDDPLAGTGARGLRQEGTWLRDADGRYVMLRGVNLASRSKRPPYLPILPPETTVLDGAAVVRELDRLRPELCRLESLGVNVVRLLVAWKAIEPEHHDPPGPLSPAGRAYLEAVGRVVEALYRDHGMLVILDFHQDIASEAYGGDGFPDWALAIDADHPRPRAAPAPTELWGVRYYDVPGGLARGVRHTLRSFWRHRLTNTEAGLTDHDVQRHLVHAVGLAAGFFAGHPAIIGYEPFNEPHPVGEAKQPFERDTLGSFYQAVLEEVASRDPAAFLLVEPRMDWTTYSGDSPEPSILTPWRALRFTDRPRTFLRLPTQDGPRDRSRVIFSFHYYDPGLLAGIPLHRSLAEKARSWPAVFAALDETVRAQGVVPFLTEFGCNQDWTQSPDFRPGAYATVARACMDLQYRQVEARLLNATYWVYDFYSRRGPDGKVSENWNDENLSLLGPEGPQNADVAARPYPLRSSARPERVAFDLESKRGTVILTGAPTDAPTVVFVPEAVHYRETGFEVRATSSRPVLWDERRQRLYWWPRAHESRHALVIGPAGSAPDIALPDDVRGLPFAPGVWRFGGVTREGRERPPAVSPAGGGGEGSAARGRAGRPGRGSRG